MNTQKRYEALERIQRQMIEWASFQPEGHFKLYGSKEINECIQLVNKLVSETSLELMAEENQKLSLYLSQDDGLNQSLGLSNIN